LHTFRGASAAWVGGAIMNFSYWPAFLLLRERYAKTAAIASVITSVLMLFIAKFG
jgi:hypothetical protein